ncbi:hypothetical protein ARMGADRAFT_1067898 [Armillaria gallica]|uniref:DUF6697 domain-containing protein n=1 Tax=Armillaria gallica TaxID=47427 RepID=A0A2H3CMM8_ARMGA|nr:hypothetical protein ARMGADRAFT_1067898 [Armillaria gallica]
MIQSNAAENSAAYDIFEQLQAEVLKPEQERNEMLTTLCKQIRDDADKLAEKHEKTQLALDRANESVRGLEESRKRRIEMYESHIAQKARELHREVVDVVDETEMYRRKQTSDLFPTKFTPDVVHDTVSIFKDIDKAMQVVKSHIGNVEFVYHPKEPRGLPIRTSIGQSVSTPRYLDWAIRGDLAIYPRDADYCSAHAIQYVYYGRYISSLFEGDEYMHLSEWHATDPEVDPYYTLSSTQLILWLQARYIYARAIAHEGLQPGQIPAKINVLSIMRDLDFGDRRISAHQLQCVGYNPLLRYRLHTTAQSLQTKVVREQSKTKKRLRKSS